MCVFEGGWGALLELRSDRSLERDWCSSTFEENRGALTRFCRNFQKRRCPVNTQPPASSQAVPAWPAGFEAVSSTRPAPLPSSPANWEAVVFLDHKSAMAFQMLCPFLQFTIYLFIFLNRPLVLAKIFQVFGVCKT